MLNSTLSKLLQPGHPLNENPLAKALYKMLERKKFKVEGDPKEDDDVLKWMGEILTLSLTDKQIPSIPKKDEAIDEHLFKSLSIKGVKKIPKSDHYSRLTFCNKQELPVSTIIMGENGVGKSSFYGSLEYVGMGEMKTAQIYDQKKEEYIKNIFSVKSDISVVLKTTNEDLTLDISNPEPNCVPAFFISEWDIRELEKMPDFGPFIFSQLGIQDFSNLLSFLISVKEKLDNALDVWDILKRDISGLKVKIEGYKFIITRMPEAPAGEIASQISDDLIAFPSLIVEDTLVRNYKEVIDEYIQEFEEDSAYQAYKNSLDRLNRDSVENAPQELRKAAHLYDNHNYQVFLTKLKEAISKCEKIRADFIEFKISLKRNVEEILDSDAQSLSDLIEEGFEKMENLSDRKSEWASSMVYSMLDQAIDARLTDTYLNELIEVLQSEFKKLVNNLIERILQPTLETLLKDYLDEGNEEIYLNYEEENRSISAKLAIKQQAEPTVRMIVPKNPIEYFNTFRFKMFVVSLKIALACCAKSIYKVNWPIVIDDVFNSSDFSNRSKMGDYIYRVGQAYDQLYKVRDLAFQLIFFTQDDVIGDAVYKGLVSQEKNARLLRLYDYRCFEQEDIDESDNDIPHIEVGIEVDSRDFNN